MRTSARAIIIQNGELLTMFRHREKDGKVKEYYVIPGGGREEGEKLEDTVKRELQEEMNVEIKVLGYLGKREDDETCAHYFHCQIINGTPILGGEELDLMNKANFYEPRFVSISEIDSLDMNGKEFVKMAMKNKYIEQIEK